MKDEKRQMHKLVSATARALIVGMWAYSALAAPPATAQKKAAPPKFKPAKTATGKAASSTKPVLVEPLSVGKARAPRLEIVHRFETIMPVGIAVTSGGRRFASYPRWTDKGEWTLAEIKDGKEIPYPTGGAFQMGHKIDPKNNLVSLQGLIGSDGIAISPDGEFLYYTPLSSRKLYRVKTAALADSGVSDEAVNRMVEDLGEKGVADGLEEDTEGRIYITKWEKRSITRRGTDGVIETIARDDRLLWPDTLDLGSETAFGGRRPAEKLFFSASCCRPDAGG